MVPADLAAEQGTILHRGGVVKCPGADGASSSVGSDSHQDGSAGGARPAALTHDVTPTHDLGISTRPKSGMLNGDAPSSGQESSHGILGVATRPIAVVAQRVAPESSN
jgi:hypothetical protein